MTVCFRFPWRCVGAVFATALILSCSPTTMVADCISLATDSNAMSGWHGTVDAASSTGMFSIDIDYAVYAPGTFDDSFAGQDPSDGTQYVYAYQISNDSLNTLDSVMVFTVGLDGNESPEYLTEVSCTGCTASTGSSLSGAPPTSATWNYSYGALGFGGKSNVLIFTSCYGPEWDFASAMSYFVQSAPPDGTPCYVPSPVPEPGTLAYAIAVIGFLLLRCSRAARRPFRHS